MLNKQISSLVTPHGAVLGSVIMDIEWSRGAIDKLSTEG